MPDVGRVGQPVDLRLPTRVADLLKVVHHLVGELEVVDAVFCAVAITASAPASLSDRIVQPRIELCALESAPARPGGTSSVAVRSRPMNLRMRAPLS